ncbi:GNAT family N-acetyltransferase [Muricauda sp. 2012CJ35-5]|uniref:GNAT family N-acetyltransferase n=1 Tax=Flagellimonas spongiicola TaxID=2942208 RepID=A0ABT0PN90_9FLAO|nr:GNAT family N-acetyltransferase [Allomuricauda spongiicola]MCL6272701.1 GNAT family N-acetyltransferase [Allomuricauda spongiicola]
MKLNLIPVNKTNMEIYISVGVQSYKEHYLHLWERNDPYPYISRSFTSTIVEKDMENPNLQLYLVQYGEAIAGIVKLVLDAPLDEYQAKDALLAQKIYLLHAYSGKGLGKQILDLISEKARKLNKNILWLDTMQKGGPIKFYLKNGFEIKKESELQIPGAIPEEKPMWVLTKQL